MHALYTAHLCQKSVKAKGVTSSPWQESETPKAVSQFKACPASEGGITLAGDAWNQAWGSYPAPMFVVTNGNSETLKLCRRTPQPQEWFLWSLGWISKQGDVRNAPLEA